MQEFGWLDQDQIDILVSLGYKNAALLYAAWEAPQARSEILHTEGLERRFLDEICCLVDLTRIQWVSPLAAKMLFSAGYRDAEAVARADAEQLCAALDAANKDRQYFKGKIGLRDSKRLIKAAAYVASY